MTDQAPTSLSLKERFERFMSSSDFAESIDALTVANQTPGRQKADYLAFNRSVIIEQKSLDRDVDAKIAALLGDLTRQHGPLEGRACYACRHYRGGGEVAARQSI